MSRVLLDAHALLWFVFDDPRLSDRAATAITDAAIEKMIGVATLWEIVIKAQIGKLSLGMETDAFLGEHVERRQVTIVPVEMSHLAQYAGLPMLHRDPFDRIIIAQSRAMDVPVVTSDPAFPAYGVQVVW